MIGVLVIQNVWRAHRALKRKLTAKFNRLSAALAIQICWRSYCNYRVYCYFRELILFKLKGLPQELLKVIVPSEVAACDKAAGVHLRFRLGGYTFPPRIYFKIFTHRAVCDVGAFAPRDYTQESPVDGFQKHVKSGVTLPVLTNIRVGTKYFGATVSTTAVNATSSWYHRIENNAWRPIASEAFEDILTPPWMKEKPHCKPPDLFHYSRLRRKDELIKFKKRRKREWMIKAYKMANPDQFKSEEDAKDFFNVDLSSKEANEDYDWETSNKIKTFNQFSNSSQFYSSNDFELKKKKELLVSNEEDLIKWSMALDFEEYRNEWMVTATSLPSEVTFNSVYQSSVESNHKLPKKTPLSNPNNYSSIDSIRFDDSRMESSLSLPKIGK